MSLLKFIKAQLGISSTPSNNFTLDASAQDGSLKLSRGNAGATTQDVMTVDASGVVRQPQNVLAFSVIKSNTQTSTNVGFSGPILFNSVLFNIKSCYSTATGRFTPTIPGYYQINFSVGSQSNSRRLNSSLFKNGVDLTHGSDVNNLEGYGISYGSVGSTLVYMNGTTDYLDVRAYVANAGIDFNLPQQTQFSGFLAVPA